MPRANWIAGLLAVAAAAAAATVSPAATGELSPLQAAHLASRLYQAGVAAGDAVMVATAARLRRDAGLPETASPDWGAMMATAESLAAGDPALAALLADLRDERSKGVVSGPEFQLAHLSAGAVETSPRIAFRGGEYAEVYVEGPPGSDFNLTVLDAAGLVVCADTDRSHVAYCGWTPATDGQFLLEIENAGSAAADYALMTN